MYGAGTIVPQQDNIHVSRTFECELSLNGVGGKGRVKGQLELYHVNATTDAAGHMRRGSESSGTNKKDNCCGAGCCGTRPAVTH